MATQVLAEGSAPNLAPEAQAREAQAREAQARLAPLRVAPGGRYFETFEGEPFLFVGYNDAVSWPGLDGLFQRRDLPAVRAYLANIAAHGVNCVRLMLEYVHFDGRYFEEPAGTFNPAMLQLWDDLFAMCEELGLRVLLAPWDNFWMTRRWKFHPYNINNGGPAKTRQSFFTDEKTIACIEARLRFVAGRWGSVLCAWDLFNEIYTNWGGTPASQMKVLARWSRAIRDEEQKVWGWTRPQSVSVFGPDPESHGGYEELIFRHPELDFATTHIYHPDAVDHPRDTIGPALCMAHWTRFGLEKTPAERPFMDTEHGPIALFNNEKKYLPEEFDDEYERHMMWAHLASGGAGSGMRWPGRHPHVLTPGMLRALASLSGFLPSLDWRHFSPRPAGHEIEIASQQEHDLHAFASRDEGQALVWLLRGAYGARGVLPRREPLRHLPLTIRGLKPGAYEVRAWDTSHGRELNCRRFHSNCNRELSLELDLENDLALAIRASST